MHPPLPGFVQFYPTLRCNQQCAFCFNRGLSSSPDMTHKDARELLNVLVQHGVSELDVMGGEPLLVGWMPDFVREAVETGMAVNLSTNGSMPDRIIGFRGISPERLQIGVSLEGDQPTHEEFTDSRHFDQAVATIKALHESGFDPVVKSVVAAGNREPIRRLIPVLAGLGVKRYFLIHMDVMESTPGSAGQSLSFPEFLLFFREISSAPHAISIGKVHASCFAKDSLPQGVRCAGGTKKLAVMPDGSAYPCNLLAHFPEFCLGSIFTDGMASVWSHHALPRLRACAQNTCADTLCSNFSSCTGGCPAHNFMLYGSTDGQDIRCAAVR